MRIQMETLISCLRQRISSFHRRGNSRGVALLQAMFLVMLITFIVNQVNFEAAVEYTVNAQALHKVRAYQAAKAGMELSLLRIKFYQRLLNGEAGMKIDENSEVAHMLYSLPISWPLAIPSEVTSVDKDGFEKINKESLMDSTYDTQIQSQELLNLNDLGSPVEAQRNTIKNKLIDLFKGKMENDRDWAEANRGIRYEEVINNIQDWVDSDTESANGGNERDAYGKLRELDPDMKDRFPPNRFFRSLEEVRMVAGVTDEFFNVLKQTFSVYGPLGINPNYADAETIKSLHPSLTDDIVGKVLTRRNDPRQGGPFTKAEEFFEYVNSQGARIYEEDQKNIPLLFSKHCSFRIQSSGKSGKSVTTITAITLDLACATDGLSKLSGAAGNPGAGGGGAGAGNPGGGSTNNQPATQQLPKGPPRIVYWNER